MANYLQLKKDYNNHKSTIKKVLNNPGCQFKLTHNGQFFQLVLMVILVCVWAIQLVGKVE